MQNSVFSVTFQHRHQPQSHLDLLIPLTYSRAHMKASNNQPSLKCITRLKFNKYFLVVETRYKIHQMFHYYPLHLHLHHHHRHHHRHHHHQLVKIESNRTRLQVIVIKQCTQFIQSSRTHTNKTKKREDIHNDIYQHSEKQNNHMT
jgi:hypothetical protein